MERVLVIGGSYFVGRVFCVLASRQGDTEITVVNRGSFKLDKPHVREFVSDRNDIKRLTSLLPADDYHALIDFCAYQPGAIEPLVKALGNRVRHYLYISTSSVYSSDCRGAKTEDSALQEHYGDDPVSQYVAKKAALERELKDSCATAGLPYTIIRPTFIYGPFNYAPRESYFIEKIVKGEPLFVPHDASARFSMVYVSDLARQLRACVGNERVFNAAFNSAAPELVNYPTLLGELQRCNGAPFSTKEISVSQVLAENIPLPFPLTEDDLVDGRLLAKATDVPYTPFSEGMDKTFAAFRNVYLPG
ncbi:MAG: NAD-dependent epimerase/dehydratase family protein [Coriobacteriales bacterium]|jgi:nucleoside-diphosphate-sugar epimerase|nr:NAD-dependent epimerase/dehydratase family protein [Coriobacteriales bacterium]